MTFGSPLILTRFCPVLTGNLYKRVISARPVYKLTLMILLSSTDTRSTTFVSSNGWGADASVVAGFVMTERKDISEVEIKCYLIYVRTMGYPE